MGAILAFNSIFTRAILRPIHLKNVIAGLVIKVSVKVFGKITLQVNVCSTNSPSKLSC